MEQNDQFFEELDELKKWLDGDDRESYSLEDETDPAESPKPEKSPKKRGENGALNTDDELPPDVTEPDVNRGEDFPELKKRRARKTERKTQQKKKRGVLAAIIAVAAVIVLVMIWELAAVLPYCGLELGCELPDASAFRRNGAACEYMNKPDISLQEEGNYFFWVKAGLLPAAVYLEVRDTLAPEVVAEDQLVAAGRELSPQEVLKSVRDASPCTYEWRTKPDFNTAGEYQAAVAVKDACGNTTVISLKITVAEVLGTAEIEAGGVLPDPMVFVTDQTLKVVYTQDADSIDTKIAGSYTAAIEVEGEEYPVTITVRDTTPPTFTVREDYVLAKGDTVDAETLVRDYFDYSHVGFSYAQAPNTDEAGPADCVILATDNFGNSSQLSATVQVVDIGVTMEASTQPITEQHLLKALGLSGAGEEEIVPAGFVGTIVTAATAESGEISVLLTVKDTKAPKVTGGEIGGWIGYEMKPEDCLRKAEDASPIQFSYVTAPDWNLEGEQTVQILVTDSYGNSTTAESVLKLEKDTEAPAIYTGTGVYYCYVGESVAYLKAIAVDDNADDDVTVEVDKSKVDTGNAGTYKVTYTATDKAGNRSTESVNFVFSNASVTREELDAEIDAWLAEILTDDMTTAQKIREIYLWVWNNGKYDGVSRKADPVYEAHRLLTTHSGDCVSMNGLVYYALQRLDGVEVLWTERINSAVNHYWILVNIGTGWYNIDAMNYSGAANYRVLMATTKELMDYDRDDSYWLFDESSYPEMTKTEFHDPDDPGDTYDWATSLRW